MEAAMRWNPLAVTGEERRATTPDADTELMLRFRSGDLSAFERLFDRHSRALVGFAYRFVRNREVAEELAQDVFLRVHDAAPGYRPEARFTTWLYRIATNVCLNEVRRPRFRAVHQALDQAGEDDIGARAPEIADCTTAGPETRLERQAMSKALNHALERLPEKQRAAFILNKYQELSYAEVAGVMQISEKAVKSLIHRAKESLAVQLRPLLPELLR